MEGGAVEDWESEDDEDMDRDDMMESLDEVVVFALEKEESADEEESADDVEESADEEEESGEVLAALQKSVLQLVCTPKQCIGPFLRSCRSNLTACLRSVISLLILIAQRAALVRRFLMLLVRPPFPL